ncbi:hypothetical protein SAMN06265795_102659 [Noviherbaspirillum humi]|uniref:DUF3828 domain-containing protein n=1 Tax=Noviherbaspirillum humi TaxID=1688639 RepID=A0A239EDW2_9BURK|nr:hypothetical protein [Noviherbaspirillum humi]SNS42836.1 hypothetical protein SAMN06265795_102659 [Noviherbaspirillum humi]
MIKRLLCVLILLAASAFSSAATKVSSEDLLAAESLIKSFVAIDPETLLCSTGKPDSRRGEKAFLDPLSDASTQLFPTYKRYFSKDFLSLFMWVQCLVPEKPEMPVPAHLIDKKLVHNDYYLDFRFGTRPEEFDTVMKFLKIGTAKINGSSVTLVVRYKYWTWPSWTRYSLVKEDGRWKIDDIALNQEDNSMEVLKWGSKSIKTEWKLLREYTTSIHQKYKVKKQLVVR